MRTHGTYSIKITDPLAFYANVIPKNADHVEIQEINDQYLAEFLTALNTSINQYSAQGERVSFLTSKSMELSKYMASVLDEDWSCEEWKLFLLLSLAFLTLMTVKN